MLCSLCDYSFSHSSSLHPLSTAQRTIPSNKSDEWENMTTKKAYIENWLQDPLFPMGGGSGSTPRTPSAEIFSGAAVSSSTAAGTQSHRGKEKVGSNEVVVGSTVPTTMAIEAAMEQRNTDDTEHHRG